MQMTIYRHVRTSICRIHARHCQLGYRNTLRYSPFGPARYPIFRSRLKFAIALSPPHGHRPRINTSRMASRWAAVAAGQLPMADRRPENEQKWSKRSHSRYYGYSPVQRNITGSYCPRYCTDHPPSASTVVISCGFYPISPCELRPTPPSIAHSPSHPVISL